MSRAQKIRVAVIGASGYTGADLVRLAHAHPNMEIVVLAANSHAGKSTESVFPHLACLGLSGLVTNEDVDRSGIDAALRGLPHDNSQQVIKALPEHLKIIDMSADFRLRDPETYAQWYGSEHAALDLQAEAVYELTEQTKLAIECADELQDSKDWLRIKSCASLQKKLLGVVNSRVFTDFSFSNKAFSAMTTLPAGSLLKWNT